MKKIVKHAGSLPRQKLANPHMDTPLEERLRKAGAIDLRDNLRIEPLGNGYSRIVPVDPSKRI